MGGVHDLLPAEIPEVDGDVLFIDGNGFSPDARRGFGLRGRQRFAQHGFDEGGFAGRRLRRPG